MESLPLVGGQNRTITATYLFSLGGIIRSFCGRGRGTQGLNGKRVTECQVFKGVNKSKSLSKDHLFPLVSPFFHSQNLYIYIYIYKKKDIFISNKNNPVLVRFGISLETFKDCCFTSWAHWNTDKTLFDAFLPVSKQSDGGYGYLCRRQGLHEWKRRQSDSSKGPRKVQERGEPLQLRQGRI